MFIKIVLVSILFILSVFSVYTYFKFDKKKNSLRIKAKRYKEKLEKRRKEIWDQDPEMGYYVKIKNNELTTFDNLEFSSKPKYDVPVIYLNELQKNHSSKKVADKVWEIIKTFGFIVIKFNNNNNNNNNDGDDGVKDHRIHWWYKGNDRNKLNERGTKISKKVVEDMFKNLKTFFDQDNEIKYRACYDNANGYKDARKSDLSFETFQMRLSSIDDYLWPEIPNTFKDASIDLFLMYEQLSYILFEQLAIYLELDDTHSITDLMDQQLPLPDNQFSTSVLRMFAYCNEESELTLDEQLEEIYKSYDNSKDKKKSISKYSKSTLSNSSDSNYNNVHLSSKSQIINFNNKSKKQSKDDSLKLGLIHTDIALGAIVPAANVAGLQIFHPESEKWFFIEEEPFVDKNDLIFFPGSITEILTNSIIKGTIHRAVHKKNKIRYSLPVSIGTSPNVDLDVFEELKEENDITKSWFYPKQGLPINSDKFLDIEYNKRTWRRIQKEIDDEGDELYDH